MTSVSIEEYMATQTAVKYVHMKLMPSKDLTLNGNFHYWLRMECQDHNLSWLFLQNCTVWSIAEYFLLLFVDILAYKVSTSYLMWC